uniref:Protein kinase domain-containing protein n=1 Tax=Grammatophora oceanica TaxID=210454 RepID=A0A7S1Y5A0_9STRA
MTSRLTSAALLLLVTGAAAQSCDLQCFQGAPCVTGSAEFGAHPMNSDGSPVFSPGALTHNGVDQHCACPHGWTGVLCDVEYKSCDGEHKCYNGGSCVPGLIDEFGNEQLFCDCTDAVTDDGELFVGKFCEHPSTELCSATNEEHFCVNGGICNTQYPQFGTMCECEEGYDGPHCEFKSGAVPDCNLNCGVGHCVLGIRDPSEIHDIGHLFQQEGGVMHCVCPPGNSGSRCEISTQSCGEHECFHGGTCLSKEKDGQTYHHCDCSSAHTETLSYAGRFCQYESTSTCFDDPQNGKVFCVNGGTCPPESYQACSCSEDFFGPSCEFAHETPVPEGPGAVVVINEDDDEIEDPEDDDDVDDDDIDDDEVVDDDMGQDLDDDALEQEIEEEEEEEEAVYALKHLHPQMTHKQRDFTASAIDLVLEAKLLGCLDHDNIVKLYGVTKGSLSNVFASSGYFLLLDRLHGTLEDKIQDWIGLEKMKHLTLTDKSVGAEQLDLRMKERSKLVDQRLGSVGLDVARGMEYLHRHRIIFRDLKPSNVGFGPDGTAKIFDFGLAREVIDSKRRMTGNTGSLRYMAPEVNRREHYGLSADIYSYGVMLWEMCTLHKPYKGMNKEEHAEMVIHKGFRPKINAVPGSPELKKLIQACWSANAQHRPNFTYVRRALLMELDVKKKMAELEELERQKRETPKSLRMKLKRQKRGKEASSGKPRRSKTSSSRPMATATNHQGSGGV